MWNPFKRKPNYEDDLFRGLATLVRGTHNLQPDWREIKILRDKGGIQFAIVPPIDWTRRSK